MAVAVVISLTFAIAPLLLVVMPAMLFVLLLFHLLFFLAFV